MKKFYLLLILAFLMSTTITAQQTVLCGDSGTSVTFNSLDLSLYSRSGCTVSYDITFVAAEVGLYKVKVANLTVVSFNIVAPGIVNFTGSRSIALPCFLITNVFKEIKIETPSSTCDLSVAAVLPVKLISFNASDENGAAVLRWATASEVNNSGFYIEHARSDDDWTELDFVDGVGTTNELQNYDFTIYDLPEGQHYFRLRQVDFDGRTEYSPIAGLYLENPDNSLKVFPNPLKRGEPLTVQGSFEQIEVYTATGQRVLRFSNAETFNNPQFLNLPAGYYHLLIQRGGEVIKEKLVVQ